MNKKIAKIEVKPIFLDICNNKEICELCQGKGYYQEKKGGDVHTCYKCLKEGKLE